MTKTENKLIINHFVFYFAPVRQYMCHLISFIINKEIMKK